MLALMLWTLCVLLLLPLARYRAMRAGAVDWDDFAPGESARVPEPARRVNRALANLLEVPVIFYALVLACLMTARVDATALALAWAYVALRMAHTIVPPELQPRHAPLHRVCRQQWGAGGYAVTPGMAPQMKHPLSRIRRLPPLSSGGGRRQWPVQARPRRPRMACSPAFWLFWVCRPRAMRQCRG